MEMFCVGCKSTYKALLLTLPSVSTLAQRQEVVDFEKIRLALKSVKESLALAHKEKLLEIYYQNSDSTSGIDAKSRAKRSLKNRCLMLLSNLEEKEIVELAKEQYNKTSSMSDKMVALSIIENSEKHHSQDELEHFYQTYQSEHLVMAKYLSLLSSSRRDGTLERVKELEKSEIYDVTVPNMVRALIGGFTANTKHFHAKDGSGYQFVADKLIEIDKINAQMASRLAGAFKLYKKMNEESKELMRVELERVMSQEKISSNLYEIVSKILNVKEGV